MARDKSTRSSPQTSATDSSRRRFLQQGGAALAGIAPASPAMVASETPRKKIRVGIVGGRFGRNFHWF